MTPQSEAAPAKSRKAAPKAAAAPKRAKAVAKPPVPAPSKPARGAPKKKGRADLVALAQKGKLPSPPDFSAETHKRFRPLLAQAVALAKAGDIEGLKAMEIKTVSSSPKAIDRYRKLAVTALEAQKGIAKADVV